MQSMLDHERLDVYQLAREFNRAVHAILMELPRGHSDSVDNLKRCAKSITRNIAEGSGKWKVADKANFYQIARGSATEATACLDELVDFGLTTEERIRHAKDIAIRLIGMLINLIKSVEARNI